jgi:hypothetical protein
MICRQPLDWVIIKIAIVVVNFVELMDYRFGSPLTEKRQPEHYAANQVVRLIKRFSPAAYLRYEKGLNRY